MSTEAQLHAANRALAEAQADIRAILEGIPAMIGYWDRDLRNRMANEAYIDYFGMTPEEIRGCHIRDVIGPELFAKNVRHMDRALAGERQLFDRTIVDVHGRTRYTQASYIPHRVDGSVVGFFVLVTDITERKLAELTAERTKDEFIAVVSHELRTPVAALAGYLDQLESEESSSLSHDGRHALDGMARNIRRISRLLDDLLTSSSSDAQTLSLDRSYIDLNHILHMCRDDLVNVAERRDIDLEFHPRADLPLVYGDEQRLQQVFDNLVSNAVKFTPPGGSISLETTAESIDGHCWVQGMVHDTGIGISARSQERMFDRFFQGDSGHARETATGGVGLGLAISKTIVEAHGGTIAVHSRPHAGSTFTVDLPAAETPGTPEYPPAADST